MFKSQRMQFAVYEKETKASLAPEGLEPGGHWSVPPQSLAVTMMVLRYPSRKDLVHVASDADFGRATTTHFSTFMYA